MTTGNSTIIRALFCALGALALLAQPVRANDWTAGVGSWFTPGNWNPNSVPTAADDATINNGGTSQIQASGAEANNVLVGTGSTLQIGDGFAAQINSLSGGGAVVIGSTDPITFLGIGINGGATTTFSGSITGPGAIELGGGSLTLTGTGTIGGDLMICDCAALTISGPGASFTATGDPFGLFGTEVDGTLNVLNGASFTTHDLAIIGSMTVNGASVTSNGTTVVGALPSPVPSSLRIENGGVLNSIGGAYIATPVLFSTLSATVTGANSVWNIGTFLDVGGATVGFGSPATLTVSNGGVVNVTGTTVIGADWTLGLGTSSITVTGAGSAFNTHILEIGATGGCACGDFSGVFTVADGAAATATTGTVIQTLGTLNLGTGGLAGTFVTPTIDNRGQIIANFTDMLTLSAAISGTGTLTKSGAGTLILTGNNTYSGATTVSGGKLVVNGSIANSAVDVQGGGTLGGSGTLGSLIVGSGGIVAPGNSIGALNIGGNWTLGTGATYEVEVKGGGNTPGAHNDVVNVSGTATIAAGTNIIVKPESGPYTAGTKYTVIQAATLNVAALPSISDSLAFLDFSGSYDANNFYLTSSLAVASFCMPGQTANQCATGNGAFSLGPGHPVFDQLLNMSAAQANGALNQLSGEAHASAQSVFIQNSGFVRDAALARVRAALEQNDNGAAALSYAPIVKKAAPALLPVAVPPRRSLWTDILGIGSRNKGDGNAAAIDGREYGFLAGVDGRVAGDWAIGALAGYTRSHFNVDARASSGDSDNLHLGVYGGTAWGRLGLRAGVANSWHFIETQRTALGQGLKADYTAYTFQTFAELGYRLDYRAAWFEPFVNAAYVAHHSGAFAETGGTAALDVLGGDNDNAFTTLGLRGAHDLVLGNVAATARGTLGWRHAFGDVVPVSSNSFVGGSAFTIAGAPIAQDAAVVEAGLDLKLSEIATLGFGYAGQFAGTANSQSGRMKLSVSF